MADWGTLDTPAVCIAKAAIPGIDHRELLTTLQFALQLHVTYPASCSTISYEKERIKTRPPVEP